MHLLDQHIDAVKDLTKGINTAATSGRPHARRLSFPNLAYVPYKFCGQAVQWHRDLGMPLINTELVLK